MPPALASLTAQPETLALVAGVALVIAGRWIVRAALSLGAVLVCLAVTLGVATLVAREAGWEPTTGWIVQGVAAVVAVLAGLWIARQTERVAFAILGSVAGGWLAYHGVHLLRDHEVAWLDPPFDYAIAVPVMMALGAGLFVWGRHWLLGATTVVLGTVLILEALRWPWMGLPGVPIAAVGLWWQNARPQRGRRRLRREDDDEDE